MAPPHGINAHLFKWLVASCVLDCVGAVRPFTAPAPSPTTCARTVEFEAMEQRQAAEASVAAAAIAAAIAASERAAELHAAEVVAMEERRCKVTLKIEASLFSPSRPCTTTTHSCLYLYAPTARANCVRLSTRRRSALHTKTRCVPDD